MMLKIISGESPRVERGGIRSRWALLLLLVVTGLPVSGQLAITEVMTRSTGAAAGGDDFWELTNFGSEPVDLSDFWFRDGLSYRFGVPIAVEAEGASNLALLWAGSRTDEARIEPGESVIFARERANFFANAPDNFRAWWGLGPEVKVVFYTGNGLDEVNDGINLWQGTPEQAVLKYRTELFEAETGHSFTYNPATGLLDTYSMPGERGARVALTTSDVASPGSHLGPVPLRLERGPASVEVDGGSSGTFTVRAHGLPVPRYQWHFNGEPIAGAVDHTFTVVAAEISNAGDYTVELDTGLERLMTSPAILTVNTQASCVTILRPLEDSEVTPYQTAVFRVETRGYPVPTFQWQFNYVDIPGATSRELRVSGVDASLTGLYTVKISNPLCSTNASAWLRVVPLANLVVTEAMANPTNKIASGHNTWWELTNRGSNVVNLFGYRWDDRLASWADAVVFTNSPSRNLPLHPGKSAIILSGMTPEAFKRWWGEENLPEDLLIISHNGNGLNSLGDEIKLWNSTALTDDEFLLDRGFGSSPAGVSLWFDPVEGEFGEPNVLGERGAFLAVESDDIGSPGWTSNNRVVRPKVTLTRRAPEGVFVTWKTQPGRTYELRRSDTPQDSNWALVSVQTATTSSLTALDASANGAPQRFYKIVMHP